MSINQLERWRDKRVEIIYVSGKGGFTKRKIRIWKVADGSVYGYCYLRNGQRKFKVDQILALNPLGK